MSGRVAVLVPIIFLASSAVSETFVFDLPFGANTTAIGQSLVFTVRGVTGPIADIDVRLSISHPDTRELAVYFGGRSLGEHIGSGANFQDTYYDMDAFGPRIGEEGANESPFAAPEWGGRRYRPQMDWSDYEQFDPNQEWFVVVFDRGERGRVNARGDQTPWGTAIGTQLIITTVPEPMGALSVLMGLAALIRRRSKCTGQLG